MSVSNTSIELVKTRLSQKTLSQLKEEAEKYRIKLSPENSERYIDAIIDHLFEMDRWNQRTMNSRKRQGANLTL